MPRVADSETAKQSAKQSDCSMTDDGTIKVVNTEDFKSKGQASQKKVARLRRCVRLFFFTLFTCVLYAIWSLAVLGSVKLSVTKRYDPAEGFQIELDGCDLDFVSGDEAVVEYSAITAARGVRWQNKATDSNIVQAATFTNTLGCTTMPLEECRRICLVTVVVPPAAAGLSWDIRQNALDKSHPVVTVTPGTTVGTLMVGQWYASLVSLSLYVKQATVASVACHLKHGYVKAVNSTIGDASVSIYESGSIYL